MNTKKEIEKNKKFKLDKKLLTKFDYAVASYSKFGSKFQEIKIMLDEAEI